MINGFLFATINSQNLLCSILEDVGFIKMCTFIQLPTTQSLINQSYVYQNRRTSEIYPNRTVCTHLSHSRAGIMLRRLLHAFRLSLLRYTNLVFIAREYRKFDSDCRLANSLIITSDAGFRTIWPFECARAHR